jgi:hypothetical protein
MRNQNFVIGVFLILFLLNSIVWCAEVEKMRVVVIQGKSDLPLNDVKSTIARLEEELAQADQYFTILDRSNLEALFGEVKLSYEDWMSEYKNDSEVRLQMEGVAADHMLFIELGRVQGGFHLSARMTKISTTERVAIATAQRPTMMELSDRGVPAMIDKIISDLFESDVVFKAGVNNVQLSIRRLDDTRTQDKDITFDGQHRERLPYGRYQFLFTKKKYRSDTIEQIINVDRTEIVYEPNRRQANIKLNGLPKSAEILVDGELAKKGFPFLESYPEGKYNVVVRKKGYYEWSQKIEINDGQDYIKTTINLQRPPRTRAMLKSSLMPGYGQYTLGYKSKGLATGTAYSASLALGIWSHLQYNEESTNYSNLKREYLAMSSNDQAAYDAVKDEALQAHSRKQLWNIVRLSGFIGGAGIWIWSEYDTWILSGSGSGENLSLGIVGNGVSLGYTF